MVVASLHTFRSSFIKNAPRFASLRYATLGAEYLAEAIQKETRSTVVLREAQQGGGKPFGH